MLRQLTLIIVLLFIPLLAVHATEIPTAKIQRVIYITLDGTRWQDIYLTQQPLAKFWKKYSSLATFYGRPGDANTIEVASVPVSLPSYQSQMSGDVQPCFGNGCGRIHVETLGERLIRQGMKKKNVAVFSSWDEIANAAEHIEGSIFTNTGNFPVYDPDTHVSDSIMQFINLRQAEDHPEGNVRFDKYTIAHALHYLEVYQPTFMWISLNDSDEAAHINDKSGYYQSLAHYDDFLDTLITKLKEMNLFENTMLIVTTDHGRGDGDQWTDHGREYPESKRTWAIVIHGELTPMGKDAEIIQYDTRSIRPAIEKALGM